MNYLTAKILIILLLLAGCIVTDGNTPTPTLSPTASDTPTATFTATASLTPTITNTPKPTATDDRIVFAYPPTITITPWHMDNSPTMIQCILRYFELTFLPGQIIIERRNKGEYFRCVSGG